MKFLSLLTAISCCVTPIAVAGPANDALVILEPRAYQVIQREGFNPIVAPVNQPGGTERGWADVPIVWKSSDVSGEWECRVVMTAGAYGHPVDWKKLSVTRNEDHAHSAIQVAAGGWYRLELRQIKDQMVIHEEFVEPFGVGEVFLIAGQSYASGANDENLSVSEPGQRVAAFNWRDQQWQVCNDPVPHVGPRGTIWPPLGDLLVPLLQVPVGFVNAAVGGTSTRQWAVDGPLFADLVTAGQRTGRFRAVLWQQGESDVIERTSTADYVERVTVIRETAMQRWGRDVPWLPAKSTLHPTVYRRPVEEEQIRQAIGELWQKPGFRPGPDTDVLDGENRGGPETMRHFSGIGQRRAAQLWFAAIWTKLHAMDVKENSR